ncbi:MAG: hypothetical protein R2867_09685 [Caldilineaceae bacterium]
MKKDKHSIPDRPFMNLTIEEMAEHVRAREAALNRRNCLVLQSFVLFAVGFAVSTWYYGHWMLETIDAIVAIGAIALAAGVVAGHRNPPPISTFVLCFGSYYWLWSIPLYHISSDCEMIIEHLWHLITGLFN